jgi:hypothetical protein
LRRVFSESISLSMVLHWWSPAGGCSVRTVGYILPAARRRLADVLDRRDLL